MSKKKATKKPRIVDARDRSINVINAHAGENGQHKGTYVTYMYDGGIHQAFYAWSNGDITQVAVDLNKKVGLLHGL